MPADDPFDFLEPQAEAPASDAAPPAPAPVEQAPAPEAAPAVEGAPAVQPQGDAQRDRFVPFEALASERDKRQEAQRAREAAERRVQELTAKPQQTVYDDPVKWQAQFEEKRQAELLQLRLEMLDQFAVEKNGPEVVQAARNWAATQMQNDPFFGARLMAQPNPIAAMIDQHRQSEQLSALGGKSLEEVIQERIKAMGLVAPVVDDAAQPPAAKAVPATVASPVPPAPPRSLASAPSAGASPGSGKISDKDIFDSTF